MKYLLLAFRIFLIVCLLTTISGCGKSEVEIPRVLGVSIKIERISQSYKELGSASACNIYGKNGKVYTVSKYRITKIYKNGNIIFAKVDLAQPAETNYVYWYDHEDLSKICGYNIGGLKYY